MTNNIDFNFIKAGKAEFTVESKTGDYFTYRVDLRSYDDYQYFSVRVLGAESKYIYLGVMRGDGLHTTGASEAKLGDVRCQVFNWVHLMLRRGKSLPEGYRVIHTGKCGRCRRKLTTPKSVESGFGPECSKKGK